MTSRLTTFARQARQLVNVLRTTTTTTPVPRQNSRCDRMVKAVSVEVFNCIAEQDFKQFLEQDFKKKSISNENGEVLKSRF